MKRIVLTGGGTAGHVTPNMALVPSLKEAGYDIQYIGSYNGIEKRLIEEMGIPYHGISSGKLRRYFDPKNFSDPFPHDSEVKTRHCILQGRLCIRSRCSCSKEKTCTSYYS